MRSLYRALLSPKRRFSPFMRAIAALFEMTGREEMLDKAIGFAKANKIDGDYLEFGTYDGTTFISAYHLANYKNHKMHFYGFDSFEGLPSPDGDDENDGQFSEGEYAFSLGRFKKRLRQSGVDLKKVTLTKGWYDKVLNASLRKKLPLKKAAIIWVDCDLYESTVPVLKFITPYLQQGTIIAFDDWFCFKGDYRKGERRAFAEWLKKNPRFKATEYAKFGRHGISFIIQK